MENKFFAFILTFAVMLAAIAAADSTGLAFNNPPNFTFNQNSGTQSRFIDLYNFASDSAFQDSNLTFSVASQSNQSLTYCYIDGGHYLSCSAASPGQSGSNAIVLMAKNPNNATATASLSVTVNPQQSTPVFSSIPDLYVVANSGNNRNMFDIFNYVSDPQYSDTQLSFSVTTSTPNGLVYCFVDNGHYISCNAPGNAGNNYNYYNLTNTVTLQATNPIGGTATASFNVRVVPPYGYYNGYNCYNGYYANGQCYNYGQGYYFSGNGPMLSSIPDATIKENSGYSSNIYDLFNYASSPNGNGYSLDFRLVGQSNTSLINCRVTSGRYFECDAPRANLTGTSTMTLQVEDGTGRTATGYFNVNVVQGNGGYCSGITISTYPVYINASSDRTFTVYVRNNSFGDFMIDNVNVFDDSSYLTVSARNYDRVVRQGQTGNLTLELQTGSVPYSMNSTVSVGISGHFTSGLGCSYSDIATSNFTAYISGNNSYNNGYYNTPVYNTPYGGSSYYYTSCSGISVNAPDVTVAQGASANNTITISNNTGTPFNLDSIVLREQNQYFSAYINNRPSSIPAGSSATAGVSISAQYAPYTNASGPVQVYVNGSFVNGAYCSGTAIGGAFNVNLSGYGAGNYNSGYSGQVQQPDNGNATSLDISLSDSSVSVSKGDRKTVTAALKNNGPYGCFSLGVSSSGVFASDVSKQTTCLGSGESSTIDITVQGRNEGNGNLEFKASANNTAKSKFVSVEVKASPEQGVSVVAQNVPATVSGSDKITLLNNGQDLQGVTINAAGLPQGVSVAPVSKSFWKSGDTVDVQVSDTGYDGKVSASILVTSDHGNDSVPVQFSAQKGGTPQEAATSGLASLATTMGAAIGFVILVVLAIIGVISITTKK